MLIYFFISLVFYSHWRIHSVSSSLKRWLCNSKTHHVCVCLIRSESNVTYKSTSIWALTIPFARSLSLIISRFFMWTAGNFKHCHYIVYSTTHTHIEICSKWVIWFLLLSPLWFDSRFLTYFISRGLYALFNQEKTRPKILWTVYGVYAVTIMCFHIIHPAFIQSGLFYSCMNNMRSLYFPSRKCSNRICPIFNSTTIGNK